MLIEPELLSQKRPSATPYKRFQENFRTNEKYDVGPLYAGVWQSTAGNKKRPNFFKKIKKKLTSDKISFTFCKT
jgi:hypothetical protein